MQALKIAGSDSRVKGLTARIGANEHFTGLAQIQELRNAVAGFRCWQQPVMLCARSTSLSVFCTALMVGVVYITCVRCQQRSTGTRKFTKTIVVKHQGVELGISVDGLQLHATQQSVCHCVDGGAGRTPAGAPQQSRMPMRLELQVLAEPSPTTWHPLLTRSASPAI